eukprot:364418-Chlamydomonas_euryale.AAC.8
MLGPCLVSMHCVDSQPCSVQACAWLTWWCLRDARLLRCTLERGLPEAARRPARLQRRDVGARLTTRRVGEGRARVWGTLVKVPAT